MRKKIGVGIIGASADRGWARVAHLPALQSLGAYEIRAVSTTRRETAERSARELGIDLFFDNHHDLLTRPEVDLAVVAVNVTFHRQVATAAIEAGKMVFCEWPLGRNLLEAQEIASLAREKGVRTLIGLQGRLSPAVRYIRDLLANGYAGKLLNTSVRGYGPDDVWVGRFDPHFEFMADKGSGATLLSIAAGHALEQLTFVLGEFTSVSSTLVARRNEGLRLRDNAKVPISAPDEVALSGVLENGALASVEYHAGSSPGPDFVWEINGLDGKLILTAEDGYANIADLTLIGRRGADRLAPLPIPNEYRLAPVGLRGPAVNVAALYGQFAQDIADGTALAPDFEAAVRRHQLIDAIERSDQTGMRAILDDRQGVHRPRPISRAGSVETR